MKASFFRSGERRDTNEPSIVQMFEIQGCSVARIRGTMLGRRQDRKGVPDLLVGYRGANHLVEVKVPTEKLSEEQRGWHAAWRGDKPYVVTTEEEAMALVRHWREELAGLGRPFVRE